jgi:hypothetical protein
VDPSVYFIVQFFDALQGVKQRDPYIQLMVMAIIVARVWHILDIASYSPVHEVGCMSPGISALPGKRTM